MICPVCKRDLAPTLSICFACGAMMNDSVREELETKISTPVAGRGSGGMRVTKQPTAIPRPVATLGPTPPPPAEPRTFTPAPPPAFRPPAERILSKPAQAKVETVPAAPKQTRTETAAAAPKLARPDTSAIAPKQTSPTLVGFQPKNPVMPDWRLQVQNSVRQRATTAPKTQAEPVAEERRPFATNGAAAIKNEPLMDSEVAPHQNPRVANALRRIEESRRAFLNDDAGAKPKQPVTPVPGASPKNRPFNVVSRTAEPGGPTAPPMISASPKPILVSTMRIEKKKYDTNKLPLMPVGEVPPMPTKPDDQVRDAETRLAEMAIADEDECVAAGTARIEVESVAEPADTDDLAPLSMRFNAALFDVIIGGFLGMALLSPFIVAGGNWMSLPGILAVAGGVFIVLFLYLTISLGVYGQTFGMRLFSLELIDADENEYPTLHQAAVHSAVFILSLAGAGLGFLPIFFNEERRAAHDLVSGTVLVKEY